MKGRLNKTLVVTVLAAAASTLLALAATPASAATQSSHGSPGAWSLSKMRGSHWDHCAGMKAPSPPLPYPIPMNCFNPWVFGPGPLIHRSPATHGPQVAVALYTLQRWDNNRWVVQATKTHVVSFGSHSAVRLPRVDFMPTRAGHFRVGLFVAWGTPDDRTLGARGAVYEHGGDYMCNTRFPCRVGGGWVWLRSPGV
jgi:hypothetical protein